MRRCVGRTRGALVGTLISYSELHTEAKKEHSHVTSYHIISAVLPKVLQVKYSNGIRIKIKLTYLPVDGGAYDVT